MTWELKGGSKTPVFLLFLLLFVLSFACAGEKAQAKLPVTELIIAKADGSRVLVRAELALTADEQARGLMFRKSVKPGEGMLFVFKYDKILSFWMKNTIVPLSIAYIDKDGVIREIYDMQPGNLSPVQSKRSLRYALEVPSGYFESEGIQPGDRIVGLPPP